MEVSGRSSIEEDIDQLGHDDLCEITLGTIRRLIHSDKLLSDLPADVTIEEVQSQIAVAHGQSITVEILRNQEKSLNVVIPQSTCTVRDLKRAIQRDFTLRQQRTRSRGKISWRYVWRTYYLLYDGQVMKDDNALISEKYGVKAHIIGSFGAGYPWYEQISRQDTLTAACDTLGLKKTLPPISQLDHILVDHKHKLLYCYVPKVACTNWKRIFMVLTGEYNTTDLMSIPASLVHENGSLLHLNQMPEDEALSCLHNYTKFVIVREPFERLLSAFRNKLEGHFPSARYFQARIGRYIIKKFRPHASDESLKKGDDVTFREFVQYLITDGFRNETVNEHWQPIHQLCYPCALNYTFIGKYERLLEDSEFILNEIDEQNIKFPMSRPSNTQRNMKKYYNQLSLRQFEELYKFYKTDFKLFGYHLDDILGYDIG